MKKHHKIISIFIFSILSTFTFGQIINRGCGTPTLPPQFETWVQSLTLTPSKFNQGQVNSIFTIPVIVHVIHNNEALNTVTATTGGNLNAAQIIDQINILNKDFNGNNSDTSLIPNVFKSRLGKFQFNFCLAVVNPTGGILAEPGIERINRVSKGWTTPPYSTNYIDATVKPASIWDPNRYLNMWVCGITGGILGYATFPNPGASGLQGLSPPYGTNTSDGLVMRNNAFGSIGTAVSGAPYNLGRTATHELGHWVGLRHIWGDANCGNDYCNDTPTSQTANYGCPVHPYKTGVCAGNTTGEMFMNYMDYSNDACMYMFTNDQKYRAQLIMTNSPIRSALITSTVCNLPNAVDDIGIMYILSPTYSQVINCNNFINPTLTVHNFGSNVISTATFSYNVDGANTQTLAWAGTLTPNTSATVTMPQVSNIPNGAHAYNVGVYSPNGNPDSFLLNNDNSQFFSIAGSFTLNANGGGTICAGNGATLTATGGATSYTWNPGTVVGTVAAVNPSISTIYTLSGSSGTCINTRTLSLTVGAALPLLISNTNSLVCPGNSSTLTASGALNYTWSTGSNIATLVATPSVSTIYTVTGANATCSGTAAVSVSVVPGPTVNLSVLPSVTICAGGTATLTGTGANTYSWSTGANINPLVVSPTVNTTYTVTGSNGACVNTKTVSVVVGTGSIGLLITPSQPTLCAGAAATLIAGGANSYTWNTGSNQASIIVSPPVTTTYTLNGTSGNCTGLSILTLSVVPAPQLTITVFPSPSLCLGSTATLSAIGIYSVINWTNPASNSSTVAVTPGVNTSYSVSASGGGCSTSGSILISIRQNPASTLTNSNSICPSPCTGQLNMNSTGGTAPYTYSLAGGNCTSMPCTNLCAGLYTIYTIDSVGCQSFNIFSIQCIDDTGIESAAGAKGVRIYPNPAKNTVNISFGDNRFTCRIFNALGQEVAQAEGKDGNSTIDVRSLAKGVYIVDITGGGKNIRKKLLVE